MRVFDGSSYMYVDQVPFTSTPNSMAIRATVTDGDNFVNFPTTLSVGQAGTVQHRFTLSYSNTGYPSVSATSTVVSGTSATLAATVGEEFQITGICASATSRTIYSNGANSTTNTTNRAPTAANVNRCSIGILGNLSNSPFIGTMRYAAFWDAVLTADSIAALAAGTSPREVQPNDLAAFWDFDNETLVDEVNGWTLINVGTTFVGGGGGTETMVNGTHINKDGQMVTVFLDDATPVPNGAVYINGIAHTGSGDRYVALWPGDGVVFYSAGRAVRPDGAQCILSSTDPSDVYLAGMRYSARGELRVIVAAATHYVNGFGLATTDRAAVTELS